MNEPELKKLLQSPKTLIMGILNVTPDSFSDGGQYFKSVDKAVIRIREMLEQGADIVDIGGESTRPGAKEVSEEDELGRVIPVIKVARKKFGDKLLISIDTYKSGVARRALEEGADMVNGVGGFRFDKKMAGVIAEYGCPVIMYHIKGVPRTMQKSEIVYKDVIGDIMGFFNEQITYGLSRGIKRERFIIDPGIGFGKTVGQNLEIIKRLKEFKELGLPVLIGVSRKSHLGILLKEKLNLSEIPGPGDRLEASLAETAIAVLNGASIIRTHDIAPRFIHPIHKKSMKVLLAMTTCHSIKSTLE